jgi:hypothetical protein
MRIENWDAERKRDSAQPQQLRIGQINSSMAQFPILNSHPRGSLAEVWAAGRFMSAQERFAGIASNEVQARSSHLYDRAYS